MVKMKMAKEEINQFFTSDILVYFIKPVAGIKNNEVIISLDECACRIPSFCIIPSVSTKKNCFHYSYLFTAESAEGIENRENHSPRGN